MLLSNEYVKAALHDFRTADLREPVRATLELLHKMCAGDVTAEDVRRVRAAGVSRQAIRDAVDVCTLFCTLSRIADALGWRIPSQDDFDKTGKFLGANGYRFPPPLRWLTPRL